MELVKVRVDEIKIPKRFRKDIGNLKKLRESIEDIGVLQPPTIRPGKWLVLGRRRLAAAILNGRKVIKVLMDPTMNDKLKRRKAELAENLHRRPLSVQEIAELGEEIERLMRENGEKGNIREKTAEKFNISAPTYGKIKAVAKRAKVDPRARDIAKEMYRTGKVHPAYKKLKRL